jgi:hypothetical protein
MMTSRLTLLTILLFTFNVNAQDLDTVTISVALWTRTELLFRARSSGDADQNGSQAHDNTDAEGRYRLIQLEPESTRSRFISGFAPQELTNITTVSGQSLQLDATLLPSDVVVEPVVITDADAPIVDTKRTITGATLTHARRSRYQSRRVQFSICCSRFPASRRATLDARPRRRSQRQSRKHA